LGVGWARGCCGGCAYRVDGLGQVDWLGQVDGLGRGDGLNRLDWLDWLNRLDWLDRGGGGVDPGGDAVGEGVIGVPLGVAEAGEQPELLGLTRRLEQLAAVL
jgi:hypothetical protein